MTPDLIHKISKLSEKEQNHILAEHYRSSLFDFAKFCMGYKDLSWRTHKDMIDALESDVHRCLIVMPRGSLKSSLGVTAFSIWSLIRNPNERILIDSEVYTNSKNFIREIKQYLESERIIKLFGQFKGPVWSESEITIAQRTHPYKEASVTAGGVGTIKVGQHYSLDIKDDLNSNKNSQTEEQRQKVIRHYQMSTSILDPGGRQIVIGTRYSSDDVIGWILKNEIGTSLIKSNNVA